MTHSNSSPSAPGRGASFSASLLGWFDRQKRDLPWRRTKDPYAIWLSEVMLQQTTVRTVEPRWQRFLQRFPTITALAEAPPEDVLHEWTGLGYYSRARNLHKAARMACEAFDGKLPDRYELLLALPGMGVYTAAAVASIAFNEPVPLVDANVERVLARLRMIEGDPKKTETKRRLRNLAAGFLDPVRPGDFNQAMMELGALVCSPKKPDCNTCPVAKFCQARQIGNPESFPQKVAKAPMEAVREVAVVLRRGEHILVLKRPSEVSFGGMWELPRGRVSEGEDTIEAGARIVLELTGLSTEPIRPILQLRHTVMRSRIDLTITSSPFWSGKVALTAHDEHDWVSAREWAELPKSTTMASTCHFLITGKLPGKRVQIPLLDEEKMVAEEAPDFIGDLE